MKLANPAVDEITAALAAIPGMVAVALGGSWARGRATADSDVDLGLYYDGEHPFHLDDVRAVAERFAITPTTVTGFYVWGPWVNGGAWLETRAGRVDFIYQFSLFHARKLAARGDVYGTAGCLTRIACELVQALFALNRVYFITDKDAWRDIDGFALRPEGIGAEVEAILGAIGDVTVSVARMGAVVRGVIGVSGELYEARFSLPGQ